MKRIFSALALFSVVAFVAACAGQPYVHKSGEFNRASSGFGQTEKDISNLTICYNSSSTTPQQVNKMAIEECAAFNKTAKFVGQEYNVCPLTTPIAAKFNCLGSGNFVGSDGQAVPGGTLMNYDGIEFRY
ncbi:MAG: hypothetical protein H8E36_05480 [Rhodospirillaceae bacterium]|nr:hypothetical protein [Rhodospirillaceae bacterium]MBL6930961.1 hypothetical protein [Rhodospirillales bacterium]MBL6940726.1 hypothetical protein [Rhodospirillales bacterium]